MTADSLPERPPDPSAVERTSVLALPDDDLAAHDVRRALHDLARVHAPGLAPLVRSAAVPEGVALTHLVPAGAVSVELLAARAPLRPGHVLAVVVAALEALVPLHAAGLAHGAVSAETLLVGPDGTVVLSGTGAAWHRPPADLEGPDPADDVEAVGRVLRDLLGPGSAPAPLVVAAVRATDTDVALRPRATELLATLRRCGRPDSLLDAIWSLAPPRPSPADAGDSAAGDGRTVGSPEAPSPPARRTDIRPARSPRRRRRTKAAPHPRLFLAGLLLAVAATAAVGRLTSESRGSPGSSVPPLAAGPLGSSASPGSGVEDVVVATPTVSAVATREVPSPPGAGASGASGIGVVDWRAVLAAVDRGRTGALAAGSEVGLRAWVTGTAYAADSAVAAAVRAAKARIEGGALVLEQVDVVRADATTAVLRVRDRRTAYDVVTVAARVSVPERSARDWSVTLVRDPTGGSWRISEVQDAEVSPAGRR